MQNLIDYLKRVPVEERADFARRCGATFGHLRNIAYGKTCAPLIAAAIERETRGVVTRRELRPKDWQICWPELADRRAPKSSHPA